MLCSSPLTSQPVLIFLSSFLRFVARPSTFPSFVSHPLCLFLVTVLFFPQVLDHVLYTTIAKANHPTVAFRKHRKTAPVSYISYGLPPPIPLVLTMVPAYPSSGSRQDLAVVSKKAAAISVRGQRKKQILYKVSTLAPPLAMDGLANQHCRHTAGVLGCPRRSQPV